MSEPQVYWGLAEIGALWGISGQGVHRLRTRYPDTFPAPDILLGVDRPNAGWHPDRADELNAWRASMPGRGARGGRKPQRQEHENA